MYKIYLKVIGSKLTQIIVACHTHTCGYFISLNIMDVTLVTRNIIWAPYIKVVHMNKSLIYNVCNDSYTKKRDLKRHMLKHHNENLVPQPCPMDREVVDSFYDLLESLEKDNETRSVKVNPQHPVIPICLQ